MGNEGQKINWITQQNTGVANCNTCHLRSRCVMSVIPEKNLSSAKKYVRMIKPKRRGDVIYRTGEPAQKLFILHAGSAQTSLAWQGEHQIICDYHLPGDALELAGLYMGQHTTTCMALESAHLCELSRESLLNLSKLYPKLQEFISLRTSYALVESQKRQLDIACKTVEQRLASFLLELSSRYAERGYSAHAFRLPMKRQEIANHLGMRTETLSRLLTTFRRQKLIRVQGREVHLIQRKQLRSLAYS